MPQLNEIAKLLIIAGILLTGAGILIILIGKTPCIGRLPGDIYIKKEHFSFYLPLTTCLFLSAVISLLVYLFSRR